jgi:hypothetical protein
VLPDPARRQLLRRELRDVTGDPWDGRTLEWATSSPPPDYNFAFTPVVHDWTPGRHEEARRPASAGFMPIHMPKNTGAGVIIAGLCHGMRLRADLAHVVVARGFVAPRRHRPHLQLQPRLLHPGRRSRPHRSERTRACSPPA